MTSLSNKTPPFCFRPQHIDIGILTQASGLAVINALTAHWPRPLRLTAKRKEVYLAALYRSGLQDFIWPVWSVAVTVSAEGHRALFFTYRPAARGLLGQEARMAWLRSMAISFIYLFFIFFWHFLALLFLINRQLKKILQDLIFKKRNDRMLCYNRAATKFLENFIFEDTRRQSDMSKKKSGKSTRWKVPNIP